ncbi:MAG: hypothetical protein Q7T71_13925 [Herbiconiux sp.]|nr:hypothetical protein [Herbiconiux sp.]
MTPPLSRRALLGAAWSAPVVVLAVAAPGAVASGAAIAFSPSIVLGGTSRQVTVSGTVTGDIATVALTYPPGFGGPPTASVVDGRFTAPVDCPAVTAVGVVVASAGTTSGEVSVATSASPAGSGTVNWRQSTVPGVFDSGSERWQFAEASGSVSVSAAPLPSLVQLGYALGYEGPASVAVTPSGTPGIGTFTVAGLSAATLVTNPGRATATPSFNAQVAYTPIYATVLLAGAAVS